EFSSATENVNHREDNHPHGVHEMPVHGKHLDTSRMLPTYTSSQSEEQNDDQHEQTYCDVKGVQTDQRVVRRAKKIRRDCETVLVNQPMPLLAGAEQEETTQHNCQEPHTEKGAALVAIEKS